METCRYCGGAIEGRGWDHNCKTSDLPRATRRDGKHAMRHHPGDGFVMWVDIPDRKKHEDLAGTSYIVGHVFDPENFSAAVYEAQEEARILMAQAEIEFGR
ncbi:MAG: hypothetical protein ABR616_18095 [Dermatophilaceae bacterium]